MFLNVYDYAKQFVEQQLVPFYDHFKKHIQAANDTLFKEIKEYEQIFDDLDAEYERCLRKQLQGKMINIRTLDAQINIMQGVLKAVHTVHGKTSSGPSTSEKPKVLASGMYTKSSKYIPPPKRANWVKPTPLPKKKQVTFQEPPRTSNRPTHKPPVQQNKKPNVSVNLSTRTKPATESRKPMPKSHTWNHRILPSKSVNARRAADHNRRLNVVDHNQFVIRSLKSVNTKTPQAKHSVNHTKQLERTRNLNDMEPLVEPLELTPSVSSSSKVTMISRLTDCKLSDRKAGSKGLSGLLRTCCSIHTTVSDVIKKLYIQSFRLISEKSYLLQCKVHNDMEKNKSSSFPDSNRYEHVRLKDQRYGKLSERRSTKYSEK
ncbi:hypothetical protein Tco_1220074 [Tanacetum coccineum]